MQFNADFSKDIAQFETGFSLLLYKGDLFDGIVQWFGYA